MGIYVSKVKSEIKRNQDSRQDTDGFYLGLYFGAWIYMDNSRSVLEPRIKWDLMFAYPDVYYKEFTKHQTAYEVSDEKMCELAKLNEDVIIKRLIAQRNRLAKK